LTAAAQLKIDASTAWNNGELTRQAREASFAKGIFNRPFDFSLGTGIEMIV
jgi:hypothetical protein